MELSFQDLSLQGALLACLGLCSIFVVSLYVVDPGLSRNHPKTVKRRLIAIVGVCICSPFYMWFFSDTEVKNGRLIWEVLGVHTSDGLLPAFIVPLLLVVVLYAGPIVQCLSEKENPFEHIAEERWDIIVRNYVVAPFAEEFVFRACMMPFLLPTLGALWTVLCCPLLFGVAHVHHLLDWFRRKDGTPLTNALLSVLLQVVYTSVFGVFSAFLFYRIGHLLSPVVSHILCNALGLPPFETLGSHPYRQMVAVVYIVGLVGFILLLQPLTSEALF